MKIVIFAPHPDDEIFGCGGSILKWMNEGHDLHIIYVTDNRVLIKWGRKENQLIENCAEKYINMSEEEIGKIGLEEAKNVARSFGFADNNVTFFKFHDQGAMDQIQTGIKLSKKVIKDAQRIVIPSDKNNHKDHQATHVMAKMAAKELDLQNLEFYVYAIYNIIKAPREKQVKVKITPYQDELYELMKGYQTQLCLKDARMGWETIKYRRSERFGVFTFDDINKYENF